MTIKVLDIFCGAGGCSVGYDRAFSQIDDVFIVGVDINPQPNYPYNFVQAHALEFLGSHWHHFDFIHASPPCQAHSVMSNVNDIVYEDFVGITRAMLKWIGKPYVIENVPGAPLRHPLMLRGDMFDGLKVIRRRLFEASFHCEQPVDPKIQHGVPGAGKGMSPDGFITVVGNGGLGKGVSVDYAREAMGIDWMARAELSQAIPPQYTHYIGSQWIGTKAPDMITPIQKDMFNLWVA